MKVHVKLFVLAAILIVSTESRPSWPDSYVGSYHYPSEAIALQADFLRYQESPYFYYNALNTIPAAVTTDEKSIIHQLPTYDFYYRTPIYDLRFPLNPLYTVLKSSPPKKTPKESTTTTTPKPTGENDEAIEKLDTKVKSEKGRKEGNKATENNNDDSITIESL